MCIDFWIALGSIGTLAMAIAIFWTLRKTDDNRKKDKQLKNIDDIINWAELINQYRQEMPEKIKQRPFAIFNAFTPITSKYLTILSIAKQLNNDELVSLVENIYRESRLYMSLQCRLETEENKKEKERIYNTMVSNVESLDDILEKLIESAVGIRNKYS